MADVELIESLKSHIASDLLENSIEFDSNTNLFDSKIFEVRLNVGDSRYAASLCCSSIIFTVATRMDFSLPTSW